jgi:hypothetical protein
MKRKLFISATAVLPLAIVLWSLLWSTAGPQKTMRATTEMVTIKTALEVYRETIGDFPHGDNTSILRLLRGENLDGRNPTRIVFLYLRKNQTNQSGETIDPWGTPYQIEMIGTNHIQIRSAGKNRSFGDLDDLVWPKPEKL